MESNKGYHKKFRGNRKSHGDFRDNRSSDRGSDRGFGRNPRDRRSMFLKKARESVRESIQSRDMLLQGVTRAVDELDHVINSLGERLEDWYGIYFPEMKIEDRKKYAELVMVVNKEDLEVSDLSPIVGQQKADELVGKSKTSLGASITPDDLSKLRLFAKNLVELYKLREDHVKYQVELANDICPNMSIVCGPELAAKLVSHVGSLTKLCALPSSTIQVLGAEKALFKHLKNRRIDPPKHGLIFQHPKISVSPKSVRGKIARALANKIALASRADGLTHSSIGTKLLADFEKRYNEIMKQYESKKVKE